MSTEIALRAPQTLFPSKVEWEMLKEQATMAVKSGLLPRAVDTVEKAIVIALKGREVGIPPMQAFSHIHVVDGKPGFSAELMLALIYKNCPGSVANYIESDEKRCVVEATRPGHKATRFSFTIEEARQAGLLNKNNWKGYPAAMLRARAVSAMARAIFPDAIMGCSHTPEELGAETDEDGQVIEIPPAKKPEPGPQPEQKPAAAQAPVQPKVRSRKEIGGEILNAGGTLGLTSAEVEKWAEEDFKKPSRQLTIEEMELFLGTLQEEIGRRSASA